MTKPIPLPSAEIIRSKLNYDPLTGEFTWKNCSSRFEGKVAGTVHPMRGSQGGYVYIQLSGKLYRAHRLAWMYMTGEEPKHLVDHVNGKRSDNRWDNLRSATSSENHMNSGLQSNNTSGVKGVFFDEARNKWKAEIHVDYTKVHVGRFDSFEEAVTALKVRREELHGEFARH